MRDARSLSRRDLLQGSAALGFSALALPLASCGPKPAVQETVLFVTLSLGNPFYEEMISGLNEGLKKAPGWRLDAQAGKTGDDATGQRNIMEALLKRHSDTGDFRLRGLVLVPANSLLELTSVVKLYNAAKIPVINLDIPIDPAALRQSGAKVDSFVGSDNVAGGRVAAGEMAKRLPKGGNILILMGVPGQANTAARRKGFVEGLAEISASTGVSYTTREWTANWNTSEALRATDSLLSSHVAIDGIFAENDLMALGAAQAVGAVQLGTRPKPVIVGYDAIPQAIEAVRKGQLDATISQEPAQMGAKAIEYLLQLAQGTKILEREIVPVKVVDRASAAK